jgi:hypothetical protein
VTYFERQIMGWLFVLAGFYFVAKSVAPRRDRARMRELLDLPTDKVKHFRNFFVQRLERTVGFLFFLIGVGLHLYVVIRQAQKSAGGNDPREALGEIGTYLAGAVLGMLLITALMHWICDYFARRTFLDILGYLMVRQSYDLGNDPRLMVQIGDMLKVSRGEDDSVETYKHRIEEALRLDDIRATLLAEGKLTDLD